MQEKILFVDDDVQVLASYQRGLGRTYKLETETSGEAGLKAMIKNGPYAVVVSDYQMPGMDGLQFLEKAQTANPDTVRIMLTGHGNMETAMKAVNLGKVFQFLTKPCSPDDLGRTLETALKQYRLVIAEKELLEKTLNGSIKVLTDILETVDPVSFKISQKLSEEIKKLATHLKLRNVWELEIAARLCMMGNVTIPPEILKRSRLSLDSLQPEEFSMVRRMPEISSQLMGQIPRMKGVSELILYQNKNFDGTGYPPNEIKMDEIPIGGRLLRVLIDMLTAELAGTQRVTALEAMESQGGKYDSKLIGDLYAFYNTESESAPATAASKEVVVKDLRPGMVLTSDIYTNDGVLIVPTGTKLSLIILKKLYNFSEMSGIKEPIFIEQ